MTPHARKAKLSSLWGFSLWVNIPLWLGLNGIFPIKADGCPVILFFLAMVTLMYSRFIKWIFTSHRTTLGWKVPFQKYLWCSGDWVMVRRNARLTLQRRRWLRGCHARLFMSPSLLALYIYLLFLRRVGRSYHVYHKSFAKRDFPRREGLKNCDIQSLRLSLSFLCAKTCL